MIDDRDDEYQVVDGRQWPFVIVPATVLEDQRLKLRDVGLYAQLARFANNQTGELYPSRSTIARVARCDPNTVDAGIDNLIAAGHVEHLGKRGRVNVLRLNNMTSGNSPAVTEPRPRENPPGFGGPQTASEGPQARENSTSDPNKTSGNSPDIDGGPLEKIPSDKGNSPDRTRSKNETSTPIGSNTDLGADPQPVDEARDNSTPQSEFETQARGRAITLARNLAPSIRAGAVTTEDLAEKIRSDCRALAARGQTVDVDDVVQAGLDALAQEHPPTTAED